MDSQEKLVREGLASLPSFNPTALRILDLIDREQHQDIFDGLERAVLADPAVAGRLMKVANSPFFGFSREIVSVREAIQVVGLKTLQSLVITVHARHALSAIDCSEVGVMKSIWRHDLLSALIGREISVGSVLCPSTMFMVGLFKNFGLSLIIAQRPDLLSVFKSTSVTGEDIYQSIWQASGIHPYAYSALILDHWRFPSLLIELLEEFASSSGNEKVHQTYLAVIQLSDALASIREPVFPARPWQSYERPENPLGIDLKEVLMGVERAHRLSESFSLAG